MTDEMIMLNEMRFRVYMGVKSHLWVLFESGVLSLSSLEIMAEVDPLQAGVRQEHQGVQEQTGLLGAHRAESSLH